MKETVARMPGAVLFMDEQLRIEALSAEAEKHVRPRGAPAVGRRCYEAVAALDAGTGRPCFEACPLARDASGPGWAFSRVLDSAGSGTGRVRREGLLLRCLAPSGKLYNLCFIAPAAASKAGPHFRSFQAIQQVYPVISGLADLGDVLSESLGPCSARPPRTVEGYTCWTRRPVSGPSGSGRGFRRKRCRP